MLVVLTGTWGCAKQVSSSSSPPKFASSRAELFWSARNRVVEARQREQAAALGLTIGGGALAVASGSLAAAAYASETHPSAPAHRAAGGVSVRADRPVAALMVEWTRSGPHPRLAVSSWRDFAGRKCLSQFCFDGDIPLLSYPSLIVGCPASMRGNNCPDEGKKGPSHPTRSRRRAPPRCMRDQRVQ
jgi:hypothetical protein